MEELSRRKYRFPLTAIALSAVVALVGVPLAANAATVTYASGVVTTSYQSVLAPGTHTKWGGWASCSGTHGALYVNERTLNATGLSVLYQGTAANCGPVSHTHPSTGATRSSCRWYWTGGGSGGSLALTCQRYT